MRKPATLLEQAMAVDGRPRASRVVTDEHLRLAIGVLQGLVNQNQASKVIGVSRAGMPSWLVAVMRQGCGSGVVSIYLHGTKV